LAAVETRYRTRPGNALVVADRGWSVERVAEDRLRFGGRVEVHNPQLRREVMLCDVRPEVRLLSSGSLDDVVTSVRVFSHDRRYPPRPDGYWTAYVVKPGHYGEDTEFEVAVEVLGPPSRLDDLYAAAVAVRLSTYGFEGYRWRAHHVVMALSSPDPAVGPPWRDASPAGTRVKPVRTHLLGPFDDPVEVVRRYALPHARPGDLVTLGESPLAVMQHRFYDPADQRFGWAATRLAQFLSGEGSLGTAGGLQTLIDEVGAARVTLALAGGLVGKAARRDGWFYRIAGPQAPLIDDVTGSLPPYDRFVVAGPHRAAEVCAAIRAGTGLSAAVVDANDLGFVDVVGATPDVPADLVSEALRTNPAGNADETTPLVLVRLPEG
jgi:hypothetical protein